MQLGLPARVAGDAIAIAPPKVGLRGQNYPPGFAADSALASA